MLTWKTSGRFFSFSFSKLLLTVNCYTGKLFLAEEITYFPLEINIHSTEWSSKQENHVPFFLFFSFFAKRSIAFLPSLLCAFFFPFGCK